MIKVRLLGELGKKYGKTHVLAIRSPAEAVRALCANFPDFERFVSSSGDRGVAYRVVADRETIGDDRLHDPIGKTLTIAPVIQGAGGGGIFQAIAGVVLIAVSFIPGMNFLLPAGVALLLGGVAQMLSPVPKATEPVDTNEETNSSPSYVFNGAVNTTAQGHPVPIGYGRMIVGSAVISAGILTEEI